MKRILTLILINGLLLSSVNLFHTQDNLLLHKSALRPQASGLDLQDINSIKSAKPISPKNLVETDFFKVIFKRYPELKQLMAILVNIKDNEMAQRAFESVVSFSDQDILRMLDDSFKDNGSIRSYVLSHNVTAKQIFLFPTLGDIDIKEWFSAPLSSLAYGRNVTGDEFMYAIYEELYATLVVLYKYAIDKNLVLVDVDDIKVVTSYMQEALVDQKRELEEFTIGVGYLPKVCANNIKRLIDLSAILIPADTQPKRESILNLIKVIDILCESDPLWQKAFDDVRAQRYTPLDNLALDFINLYDNGGLLKKTSSSGDVRAIFFDIGNVVLKTNYQKVATQLAKYSTKHKIYIYNYLVSNELMVSFETGKITVDEFYLRVGAKLHLGLSREKFITIFNGLFTAVNREVVEDIKALKSAGIKIYFVTDTNPVHREFVQSRYKVVLELADGIITSYENGSMKREPSGNMFRVALKRAGIEASQALFVDDLDMNLEAPRKMGIKSIKYRKGDRINRLLSPFIEGLSTETREDIRKHNFISDFINRLRLRFYRAKLEKLQSKKTKVLFTDAAGKTRTIKVPSAQANDFDNIKLHFTRAKVQNLEQLESNSKTLSSETISSEKATSLRILQSA